MALINCPECSKQISDKSPACIHCGYPLRQMQTQTTTESSNQLKKVVLDGIVEEESANNERGVTRLIKEFMGLDDIMDVFPIYRAARISPQVIIENIDNSKALEIAEKFNRFQAHVTIYNMGDTISSVSSYTPSNANMPKCPTCSSKDIMRLNALDRVASVALLGLASGSIGKQFYCKKCQFKW